ncbi:hypothetical protein CCHR01_06757 [Colletotrichum chrysophilum]|uniref:Uncharacterized protein n=1 Tax=Colletotrichum chrysophilum TaxID=1836956 RepID=A0AAD9AP67_9PEZI|nr:hypothetical protein CCHR01_06757 [Colletotrichum chrysophilum]
MSGPLGLDADFTALRHDDSSDPTRTVVHSFRVPPALADVSHRAPGYCTCPVPDTSHQPQYCSSMKLDGHTHPPQEDKLRQPVSPSPFALDPDASSPGPTWTSALAVDEFTEPSPAYLLMLRRYHDT